MGYLVDGKSWQRCTSPLPLSLLKPHHRTASHLFQLPPLEEPSLPSSVITSFSTSSLYHSSRFSDPFFFLVSLPLSRPRLAYVTRSLDSGRTSLDRYAGKPVNLAERAVSSCSILESVASTDPTWDFARLRRNARIFREGHRLLRFSLSSFIFNALSERGTIWKNERLRGRSKDGVLAERRATSKNPAAEIW